MSVEEIPKDNWYHVAVVDGKTKILSFAEYLDFESKSLNLLAGSEEEAIQKFDNLIPEEMRR